MRGFRWLIVVFVLTLCIALLIRAPAAIISAHAGPFDVAGAPLTLSSPQGTLWRGGMSIRWRELTGRLSWQLDWHGLMPGAAWQLSGEVQGSGWVGGRTSTLIGQVVSARAPANLLHYFAPFRAEGELVIEKLDFRWSDQALVDAAGQLRYSGGQVGWANGGEAVMPPLGAKIEPAGGAEGAIIMRVTDDNGSLFMEGRVQANQGEFKVFRSWPILLGVSGGGDPSDVVFETSRPLW